MSMTKAGKRPMRSLSANEKLAAVKRVSAGGESKASVARDIGVPESTLRGWCKNQAKIYNQANASEHEELDMGPLEKRTKMDEPYNLSMKDGVSTGSYSPNSQYDPDQNPNEAEGEPSPNIRASLPNNKTSTPLTSVDKERERNRAELARLSAELGLNRPEVLMSGFNGHLPVNEALLFWNSICTYQRQLMTTKKYPSAMDTTPTPTNGVPAHLDMKKLIPNIEPKSVHDTVNRWLQQHPLVSTSNTPSTSTEFPVVPTTSSPLPSTSTATNNNTSFINSMSTNSPLKQMGLWNWYKPGVSSASQIEPTPNKHILYKQLTKEAEQDNQDAENETVKEEKPRNCNKNRSVLDNIFLNNSIESNGVRTSPNHKHDESPEVDEVAEAVQHGEKFLKWLESCSHPSVTAVQIVSLQTLMRNLKKSVVRKNGEGLRAKVRRK